MVDPQPGSRHAGARTSDDTSEHSGNDSARERRDRFRRLSDVLVVLDALGEDESPPLTLLFRLSELGIRDPASLPIPVLRKRVAAIQRLYLDRLEMDRRESPRRDLDGAP